MAKGKNLSIKQKRFVKEYASNGGNGTQAIKDAGYNVKSSDTARAMATENLAKPNVKGALKEAEGTLRGAAESARVFGNRRLQFDMADETFNINRRFIENFTPQQLRQSSLVPRYDLIANVLERPGYMKALSQGQKGID